MTGIVSITVTPATDTTGIVTKALMDMVDGGIGSRVTSRRTRSRMAVGAGAAKFMPPTPGATDTTATGRTAHGGHNDITATTTTITIDLTQEKGDQEPVATSRDLIGAGRIHLDRLPDPDPMNEANCPLSFVPVPVTLPVPEKRVE